MKNMLFCDIDVGIIFEMCGNILIKIEPDNKGCNVECISLNSRHYRYKERDIIYPSVSVKVIYAVQFADIEGGKFYFFEEDVYIKALNVAKPTKVPGWTFMSNAGVRLRDGLVQCMDSGKFVFPL